MKFNLSRVSAILFALVATLMAGTALAAGTGVDMFAPPQTDKSVSLILAKLFAGLLDNTSGATDGTGDPFVSVIGKFNEAVLFIGGILLAYGILAGTMQTAHDGEMLGKKWSSMWVPLRTSLGVGMIIPAGQGYCAIQYLVMWLVVQGVGIADTMWTSYIANIGNGQSGIAISQNIPGVEALGVGVLEALVCEKTVTKRADAFDCIGADTESCTKAEPKAARVAQSQNGYSWDLTGGGQADRIGYCGGVELGRKGSDAQKGGFGDMDRASSIFKLTNSADAEVPKQVIQAHQEALNQMINDLDSVAQTIVNNEPFDSIDGKLAAAVAKYKQTVWNKALSQAQVGYMDSSNYSQDGWLLAGAWYMRLMKISNQMNEAVRAVPKAIRGEWMKDSFRGTTNIDIAEIESQINRYRGFVDRQARLADMGISGAGALDSDKSAFAKVNTTNDGIQTLFDSISKAINAPDAIDAGTNQTLNNQSPVMIVKSMGDKIIAGAIQVLEKKDGNGLALDQDKQKTETNQRIETFAQSLGYTLLAFGFTASYLVPMTPFIIWIACALGWAVMVVEAIIAAPLWAIMHVHPDGEGLTGRGGNGYSLVLSVVLRPGLMVFGLVASIALMYPFGSLVNEIFASVFELSVGGMGTSNVTDSAQNFNLTKLAGLFIYVGLMMTLVNKIFSLIHILPDQIIRWIGGSQDYFGKGMEQEATGVSRSAVQQMTGAANNSLIARGTGAAGGGQGQAPASAKDKHEMVTPRTGSTPGQAESSGSPLLEGSHSSVPVSGGAGNSGGVADSHQTPRTGGYIPAGMQADANGEYHLDPHAQDGSKALYAKTSGHEGQTTPRESPFVNPEQKQPPSSYEV